MQNGMRWMSFWFCSRELKQLIGRILYDVAAEAARDYRTRSSYVVQYVPYLVKEQDGVH